MKKYISKKKGYRKGDKMLINTEKGLELSKEKVVFLEKGVEKEKIIGTEGKEWWKKLFNKHGDKELIKFDVVEYEQEVIDRLEKVKTLDLDLGLAEEYVFNGKEIKDIEILNLKEELSTTQDALNFIIMNGGV